MGYSGSYSAYQALKAVKVSEDQLERYYWALSQTVNVDEEIVKSKCITNSFSLLPLKVLISIFTFIRNIIRSEERWKEED